MSGPPAPAEHHPEQLLKVVMPELPAGGCCGESRSPLAKACHGGAGPAGGTPMWGDTEENPSFGVQRGCPLAWLNCLRLVLA